MFSDRARITCEQTNEGSIAVCIGIAAGDVAASASIEPATEQGYARVPADAATASERGFRSDILAHTDKSDAKGLATSAASASPMAAASADPFDH